MSIRMQHDHRYLKLGLKLTAFAGPGILAEIAGNRQFRRSLENT